MYDIALEYIYDLYIHNFRGLEINFYIGTWSHAKSTKIGNQHYGYETFVINNKGKGNKTTFPLTKYCSRTIKNLYRCLNYYFIHHSLCYCYFGTEHDNLSNS